MAWYWLEILRWSNLFTWLYLLKGINYIDYTEQNILNNTTISLHVSHHYRNNIALKVHVLFSNLVSDELVELLIQRCQFKFLLKLSRRLAVVCVRSTDLPVGCVGGSLMHRLIYCIWCDVREVCNFVCCSSPLPYCVISLTLVIIIVSFIVFDVMCVRCADLLLGCVGGPLMHHLVCYGVWWGCRPAPGLCRWVSLSVACFYISSKFHMDYGSNMNFLVISKPSKVWNLLLGCVGGSLSLSHYLSLLWCVWGLPNCSWVMSVDLSRIYPILFLMCVGSTDLLLGYVGGPLMHRLNFMGLGFFKETLYYIKVITNF